MSHRTGTRLVAVTALALLVLSGCEADDEGPLPREAATGTVTAPRADDGAATRPAPSDDASADTGPTGSVTAASGAFRVLPPPGWSDVREGVDQPVEIALRADRMSDDFFSNVVVAKAEPIADVEQSLRQAAEDIAGRDGTHEILDPIQVAGEPAPGYTVTRTTSGVEIIQTQRWIQHGDQLYVVTLSAASSRAEEGEEALAHVLGSWEWLD